MSQPRTTPDDAARTETLSDNGGDLLDNLAEEFAARCRNGESPTIAEYEDRHPDKAERIRRLLTTVAMMEQWKRGEGRSAGRDDDGGAGVARGLPGRLGEFQVLREIGRGGMGVVYEAVQESLGRHVALKVIHEGQVSARRLQRFEREARAVAKLHHTNIVPIFGVGEHQGLPFYAMQFIEGKGLDDLLAAWRRQEGPPGEDRWRFITRVGIQAAEALQYAHEQGVLHRDIKPANLLLDENRTIWVTDFGLAKMTGHDDLTASGDVVGTLRYLAPEALRGESDGRSDVYSLGLTLYELLTLSPPFGELTPSELLRHVGEGELPRPRRLEPDIPRDLETIVLKAIAREPSHRYPSAGDLAYDLQCFLEDRPIRARPTTRLEHAWRWSRRNRMTATLAAIAVISVVLAAVIGWVGYASTTRALKRADDNVELSLAVFESLFERLAENDPLLPPPVGGDLGGPPARGHAGGRRPFDGFGPGLIPREPDGADPFGPDAPPPDEGGPRRGGPGRGGRRPPPPLGDSPPPLEGRPPGMGDRGPGSHRGGARDDTTLLLSVLTFYDRFARQNAANPRLEGEAAWAYRKVGALYDKLGRDTEAEAAYARSISMFESLIARFPAVAAYRYRLVQTCDMAEPRSAPPAVLNRLDRRLAAASAHIDRLVAEDPNNAKYLQTRDHVYIKHGVVLHRLGRLEEAEGCYRKAIDFEQALSRREPENDRPLLDLATTREDLGLLVLKRGHKEQARSLLDSAAADLEVLALGDHIPPPLSSRFASLALAYEALGDKARAEALNRRADDVSSGPRHRPPGPGAESFPPPDGPR